MISANCPICGGDLYFEAELITFKKLGCNHCDTHWFYDSEKGVLTFNMNANIQAFNDKNYYANAV